MLFNRRNKIDALKLVRERPPGTVACAFFDPQYRSVLDKMKYGNEGARQIRRAALPSMTTGYIRDVITEIESALRPSGHLFLWVDKFILGEGVQQWANTELALVDFICWNKGKIGMGYRTRRKSEYLCVFQKEPKRAKGVWTDHTIPDVWGERAASLVHPHAKPIGLVRKLIEAVTVPGDIVLDPAAGSFVVLDACKMEPKRNFIGGDING